MIFMGVRGALRGGVRGVVWTSGEPAAGAFLGSDWRWIRAREFSGFGIPIYGDEVHDEEEANGCYSDFMLAGYRRPDVLAGGPDRHAGLQPPRSAHHGARSRARILPTCGRFAATM